MSPLRASWSNSCRSAKARPECRHGAGGVAGPDAGEATGLRIVHLPPWRWPWRRVGIATWIDPPRTRLEGAQHMTTTTASLPERTRASATREHAPGHQAISGKVQRKPKRMSLPRTIRGESATIECKDFANLQRLREQHERGIREVHRSVCVLLHERHRLVQLRRTAEVVDLHPFTATRSARWRAPDRLTLTKCIASVITALVVASWPRNASQRAATSA